MSLLVDIRDLRVGLVSGRQERALLAGVELEIHPGEALGLVGESGSGKTTTARSIVGALPRGARATGTIEFAGHDVLKMGRAARRELRATSIAFIAQNPRTAMNPLRRVGDFATEALIRNGRVSSADARARITKLLGEIGIKDPERVLDQYPDQLSGGMLQRVVIAAAVAVAPRLIIADEPTSALDVTTQSDVLATLTDLCRHRDTAMLLITHDLDLASSVCDRTAVMYAGRIVEESPSRTLEYGGLHPYTIGLTKARTRADVDVARLDAIPGLPIAAYECEHGCPFAPRCPLSDERCRESEPPITEQGTSRVACWHQHDAAEPLRGDSTREIAGKPR